jgi:hypothetical protein
MTGEGISVTLFAAGRIPGSWQRKSWTALSAAGVGDSLTDLEVLWAG